MKNKLPYKTFNLFDSYNADIPFTERLYRWIISIGRYIVIGTEMIVLAAFISRFILDQNLNDLTEKVNDNNTTLTKLKDKENTYRTLISKVGEAKYIESAFKATLINEIPKLYTLAPSDVQIASVDYGNNLVDGLMQETLTVILNSPTATAPKYQAILEQNILNTDNKVPNPNILIKLLNVSNSDKNFNNYNFTFKITKLG